MMRERRACLRLFAAALMVVGYAALGADAVPSAWRATDSGFELALARGTLTCDSRGRMTLRAEDQPALELVFFLWHGAYLYETQPKGHSESATLEANGVLRLVGLWGAREGSAPVRYTMDLVPSAEGAEVRLALEALAKPPHRNA